MTGNRDAALSTAHRDLDAKLSVCLASKSWDGIQFLAQPPRSHKSGDVAWFSSFWVSRPGVPKLRAARNSWVGLLRFDCLRQGGALKLSVDGRMRDDERLPQLVLPVDLRDLAKVAAREAARELDLKDFRDPVYKTPESPAARKARERAEDRARATQELDFLASLLSPNNQE